MIVTGRALVAAAGFSLLLAGSATPSHSVPIDENLLTIEMVGTGTDILDGDDLGCVAGGKAGTFTCSGSNAVLMGGDLTLDSWTWSLDQDPSMNNNTVITNNSGATQTYIFSVLLPVTPVLPSSRIGGSIQGGITSDGSAGTLSSNGVSGNAIYRAFIDGNEVATLLPHSSSISSGPFLSDSFDDPPFTLDFGTPIPSDPGPAALATIGIDLEFTLTAGDSASFTSVFVVEPIPEPGTAALMSLGLVGLALRRRLRG